MAHYLISYDLHITENDNRNKDYQTLTDYLNGHGYCSEQESVYLYSSEHTAEYIHEQLHSLIKWHSDDKLLVSEIKHQNSRGITSECFVNMLKAEQANIVKQFNEIFNGNKI